MSSFLRVPRRHVTELAPGNIAILGAAEATPYEAGKASHSQGGPAAIRNASQRYANWHDHFDFDTQAPLLNLPEGTVVDLGDIEGVVGAGARNRETIQNTVASILGGGAWPLVLGGDDSVPIPVLRAYEGHGPIWVVQIDAHMDWRHERFGERLGWSSPMRRASEMKWVEGMVQFGIRGVGSAFANDVIDAKTWGAKIVTAREIFRSGVDDGLAHIPTGANVFISLDLDALDPAIMPGVMAQAPGGLNYWHVIDILDGLAAHQKIVGCNIVELAPQRDPSGVSATTAARIACNVISAISRSQE
jgi:agmatinase